jgi:SAM-dependent methyltransferase
MAERVSIFLDNIVEYYAGKLSAHGCTPRGVDWNNEGGQFLRFDQLSKILDPQVNRFSLNDIGCGYGALLNYLRARGFDPFYKGLDISADMIGVAQRTHEHDRSSEFYVAIEPRDVSDYSVASGIFNVRLSHPDSAWNDYMKETLDIMDRTSRLGFSFNFLSSYSDLKKRRPDLYYADPCEIFDLCVRRYSRNVSLIHDYGLYEFTILVRKTS